MENFSFYQELSKPSWAPPAEVFGPVWTLLYVIIAVSFGYVAYLFRHGRITFAVLLPFLLNIVFNIAFTPIQFGLKNNVLASVDVFLVLVTLIWALVAIYPHARWVVFVNIPYMLWVSFATVLQFTVTWLNW